MADADTTSKHEDSQPRGGRAVSPDEEPLDQAEMGDEDSGGVAGQGGMRDQTKTSDDGKFKPS